MGIPINSGYAGENFNYATQQEMYDYQISDFGKKRF
jgi:hypothetical protein